MVVETRRGGEEDEERAGLNKQRAGLTVGDVVHDHMIHIQSISIITYYILQ